MIIWALLGVILLIIAVNDFLFFRIEDETVLSICVLYVISCVFGFSGHNFQQGFLIAVGTFVITFVLNHYGLIGGGDVKFLFPLILFAENNLEVFLVGISIAGIILSVLYMLFGRYIYIFRKKTILKLLKIKKKNRKNALLNIALLSLNRISNGTVILNYRATSAWRQEIPYGVALSYGGFCVILEILLSR